MSSTPSFVRHKVSRYRANSTIKQFFLCLSGKTTVSGPHGMMPVNMYPGMQQGMMLPPYTVRLCIINSIPNEGPCLFIILLDEIYLDYKV